MLQAVHSKTRLDTTPDRRSRPLCWVVEQIKTEYSKVLLFEATHRTRCRTRPPQRTLRCVGTRGAWRRRQSAPCPVTGTLSTS